MANFIIKKTIVIGTRFSPLALIQVQEIINMYDFKNRKINYNINKFYTSGDRDKLTSISKIEGTDFFTDSIDEALLKGEIDLAIHSAKDLPENLQPGLKIAVLTNPIDSTDALISKNNLKLKELPLAARIGASSLRRKEQLIKFRSDFQIVDIRGNIEERIAKYEKNNLDGLIVATCALIRLSLENKITERIPIEILKPSPLQGSLSVVIRENDYETIKLFE